MKKLPYSIKQKLRQIHKHALRGKELDAELTDLFREYDFNVDVLTDYAGDTSTYPVETEALSILYNAEGSDCEGLIKEIEEVFLYYVNRGQRLKTKQPHEGRRRRE